jgi:hypothetical protein
MLSTTPVEIVSICRRLRGAGGYLPIGSSFEIYMDCNLEESALAGARMIHDLPAAVIRSSYSRFRDPGSVKVMRKH